MAKAGKGADEVRASLRPHARLAADEERRLRRLDASHLTPLCGGLRGKLGALELGKILGFGRGSSDGSVTVVVLPPRLLV